MKNKKNERSVKSEIINDAKNPVPVRITCLELSAGPKINTTRKYGMREFLDMYDNGYKDFSVPGVRNLL